MIVIYNKNGTITNLKLDSYVNQGSSGVNKIFVYIDGYEPSEWTITAVFSLPNGTTNNLLVTTEDTEKYGETEYKGRSFYLTQAQTYYAGNLGMTITLLDDNGRVLVTSRFDIIINETGVTPEADETEITRQLYYSLVQELNTKLDTYYAQKQILKLSDNYINEITNTNVIIRPYIDEKGQFSSMVNNIHNDEKNSDYQYRLNFDGESDNAYIDTHLSKTGSIYTAVTGENAAININLLGDNSLLFAQLDGYSNIRFIAKGNDGNKALEFLYVATDYKDEPLSGSPLLLLKNDGINDIKYGLAYDVQNNKLGYATKENGSIVFHENDTFVARKTGDGFKLYGHAEASEIEVPYDLLATANTVALRTSNGNVLMTAPTEDLAGANKKYVDDALNNKLDKLTTDTSGFNGKLYAHSGADQIEFGTTAFSTPNTIPYRNENGTFDVQKPINGGNVANKEYVDNLVSNTTSAIKKNAYIPVDTTTYATLDDFLKSTGEEGYMYLYPIDTADNTKGYYQYVWEGNGWVSLSTTSSISLDGYYASNADIVPDADNTYSLGSSSNYFKDAYINKLQIGSFWDFKPYGVNGFSLNYNNSSVLSASGSFIYVNKHIMMTGNMVPVNNSYSLGQYNRFWGNLYLNNQLIDANENAITIKEIVELNTWGSSLKQYMEYDDSGYIQVSSNLQVNQNIICDGDIVENMTGYDIVNLQSSLEVASTGKATITPLNCKVVKNGNALTITGAFKVIGNEAGAINAQTISKIPYTIRIPSSVGEKITDLGSAFIGSCVMRACDSNYTGTEELNITFHKSSSTTISTLLSISTPWTVASNNFMTLGTTFSYQLVLLLNESLF